MNDVRVGLGDLGGNPAEHATFVVRHDVDARRKMLGGFVSPGNVDPAFRFFRTRTQGNRALIGVYHQAMSDADTGDDAVTGQWAATRGELDCQPFITLDQDGYAARVGQGVSRRRSGGDQRVFRRKPSRHHSSQSLTQSDIGKNFSA